jgi:TonB family protein
MRARHLGDLACWAVALASFAWTPPARAQEALPRDEAPAQAPRITKPVPKNNQGARYPKQALDEGFYQPAEVSVLITVDVSGLVTNAQVEKAAGHGFDEAALEAAKSIQFDPATRDGEPIAARTRVLYKFVPPPAVLTGHVVTLVGERPIAGATVTVVDPAGGTQVATTGVDGDWHVEGAAAGTYRVDIAAPGMQSHSSTAEVKPGEEVSAVDRLAREPVPVAADAGAGDENVEEVEVRGKKPPREVVKRSLEQREIDRVPGTSGDALLSLQNLPGVARSPPLSGFLLIRGAGPMDSQVYVDGTPIPIVYHFGGLASVVPTEVLDHIDLYPGNFSTQYGRAMGGVVDVGIAPPKSDKLHAIVEVNLLDSRFVVQGPVFDTGWRFTLAGRRSYLDTWLGPVLTAAGANVSVAPVYYDYQAMLERDLTKRSSLRLLLLGSDDRLALLLTTPSSGAPTLTGTVSDHTGFWLSQATYKNHLSDKTDLRLVAGFGQTYVDFNVGSLAFNLTSWNITGRAELSTKLDPLVTMNVGLDIWDYPYTLSADLPPLPRPGQPPPGPFSSQMLLHTQTSSTIFEPAAYVEWEATPWRGTRIVPGLRLDYDKDTGAWDLDPRVVARQDVTTSPRTTLKAAVGLFSQPPQPQETNPVFGMSGLTSNRALQYDVGVEREVTPRVEATLDGFYKQLDHLVVQDLGNTGSGVIYGGEALIRYKATRDDRFFGWLSYTLSRSLRRDAPGLPLRIFEYDETHVLTVLGSYRLGRGWEFGARFRLTSGYMYTPQQYGFYDENVGTYSPLEAYPPNGSRLPLWQALDLRVDKQWRFGWGSIRAYLNVNNVYNAANVAGVSYNFNSTRSSYVNDLPILPSLGLRVDM